jgi:RNA polymerase sigma-70 factor, ECF subfamily
MTYLGHGFVLVGHVLCPSVHNEMEEIRQNFSKVYDTYVAKIYRFVYLKVSSQEIAEDLSSEVFVRVWEIYRREVQIENIQAYIYQIARNTVADYYRGKKVQIVANEETIQGIADITMDIDQQAQVQLEMERIRKALQALNQDYQDLVIWRYIEELSVPEIAQITGKTEDNVRVGIHRALQALKAQMPELAVVNRE